MEATSLHPVPCNQQSRGQGEHRRSGTARDSAIGSELLNCDEIQELCPSDGSKSSDSRPSVSEADIEEEEGQGRVFDLVGASPNDQGRQQAQVLNLQTCTMCSVTNRVAYRQLESQLKPFFAKWVAFWKIPGF